MSYEQPLCSSGVEGSEGRGYFTVISIHRGGLPVCFVLAGMINLDPSVRDVAYLVSEPRGPVAPG